MTIAYHILVKKTYFGKNN